MIMSSALRIIRARCFFVLAVVAIAEGADQKRLIREHRAHAAETSNVGNLMRAEHVASRARGDGDSQDDDAESDVKIDETEGALAASDDDSGGDSFQALVDGDGAPDGDSDQNAGDDEASDDDIKEAINDDANDETTKTESKMASGNDGDADQASGKAAQTARTDPSLREGKKEAEEAVPLSVALHPDEADRVGRVAFEEAKKEEAEEEDDELDSENAMKDPGEKESDRVEDDSVAEAASVSREDAKGGEDKEDNGKSDEVDRVEKDSVPEPLLRNEEKEQSEDDVSTRINERAAEAEDDVEAKEELEAEEADRAAHALREKAKKRAKAKPESAANKKEASERASQTDAEPLAHVEASRPAKEEPAAEYTAHKPAVVETDAEDAGEDTFRALIGDDGVGTDSRQDSDVKQDSGNKHTDRSGGTIWID